MTDTTKANGSPLVHLTGTRKPVEVDTSQRVRPEWQRDLGTAWATTMLFLHRNLYRARRQAFYSPVYLGLLLMYAPRGLVRVVATLTKYLYDYDSAAVRHQHAGNVETPEYAKAQAIRKANLKARWMVAGTAIVVVLFPALAWTAPVALAWIVAPALFVWVVKMIPGKSVWEYVVAAGLAGLLWWWLPSWLATIPRPPAWPFLVAAPLVVLALGWHGRNREKPIVKSSDLQSGGVVEPIRAPMVTAALCTLGNPRMTQKTQADPATAIRLLMDVARQGAGYQVDMELPPGVPASDVQEKRTELAAAMRRELGCVFPSVGKRHPGHLSLYISDQPMSTAAQAPWPLLKGEAVDLFGLVPMFTNNVGAWVRATFAYTAWVCGAVPRMGKTYFVRQFGLVAGLDVRAKVLAFDLKGTGDLSALAKFAHFYSVGDEPEDVEQQLEAMRWVKAEMRRRTKLVRELTLEENPERGKVTAALATLSPAKFGPIVVCVDECQVWFQEFSEALPGATADAKDPGKAVREEFIAICRDLVKRGPALGIICLFATQKPSAKSIPSDIADNASARLAFKVNGQISNDQILGTSSYQAGLRATQFGFEDKGVAYYRGEGADALIVRTVHGLDATVADELADKARAMRVAAGLLTGAAANEEMEEAVKVDLLDDVREVMDAEGGRARMGLTAIRERLALLRERHYGDWTNEALGSALRGMGVTAESVHCPVEGRSVKGLKRERLDVHPIPKDDESA